MSDEDEVVLARSLTGEYVGRLVRFEGGKPAGTTVMQGVLVSIEHRWVGSPVPSCRLTVDLGDTQVQVKRDGNDWVAFPVLG